MTKKYRRGVSRLLITACLLTLSSIARAEEARVCWINANAPEGDALDMRMGGKLIFRSVEPGRMTAWVGVGEGTATVEVRKARSRLDGDFVTLPLTEEMRTLLVSVAEPDGGYRTSGVRLDGWKDLEGIEVFNALADRLVKIPEEKREFSLRGGGRRVIAEPSGSMKLAIAEPGEGITSGEIVITQKPDDLGGGRWLLVLLPGEDGTVDGLWVGPNGLILSPGEKFQRNGVSLSAPPLKYDAKKLPEGIDGSIREGGFDPRLVDWRLVDSKFAWINAIPSDRSVSLSLNGFTAIRRLTHGVPSGFVPWPNGKWEVSARMAGKFSPMASTEFVLPEKGSALLVSAPLGKAASTLLVASGLDSKNAAILRIVNAVPVGDVTFSAESENGEMLISGRIKGGEMSAPMELQGVDAQNGKVQPSKRVARIRVTLNAGAGDDQVAIPVPVATLSEAGGDWVVVMVLDDESRADILSYFCRLDEGGIYLENDLNKAPSMNNEIED